MRSAAWLLFCWLTFAVITSQKPSRASGSEAEGKLKSEVLGRQVEDFRLQDFRGKAHSLSDYADQQAIVLCFLGTECPLAKLYGPRVQKLNDQFSTRGVTFLGISSNSQDSLTELAAYARIHE